MTLREYDVVRLQRPLPQHGLPIGAIGTVVMVYVDPPGYEVEFCDQKGITLALVSLSERESDGLIEVCDSP